MLACEALLEDGAHRTQDQAEATDRCACNTQGCFAARSFGPRWLLGECTAALQRIASSGKAQATLAAGAIAGLSAAFAACKVPMTPPCRGLDMLMWKLCTMSLCG